MKKLIATITLIAAFTSAPAFAKTEGNYIGVNLLNTNMESDSDFSDRTNRDNDFSAGVDYKYAFNFNNFFIAPGLFYNHNDVIDHERSGNIISTDELKYSYGVKLDLGYDITDNFAIAAVIGHSENRRHAGNVSAISGILYNDNATDEAFIYGLGLKYSVTKNLDLTAGYEISQYGKSNNLFDTTDEFRSDYQVARVGVAFNF